MIGHPSSGNCNPQALVRVDEFCGALTTTKDHQCRKVDVSRELLTSLTANAPRKQLRGNSGARLRLTDSAEGDHGIS